MKSDLSNTVSSYTDFQGLAELRRAAKEDPRKALETVAKQFEAIFMDMVLKSVREAELGDGLFDSSQSDFYRGMLDHEMALKLSDQGALGLATMLVRQLEGSLPAKREAEDGNERQEFAVPDRSGLSFKLRDGDAGRPVEAAAGESAAPQAIAEPASFESPEEFVRYLWPYAEGAGKALGVAPEALVAQAALETGWGRAILKGGAAGSSHNLFNIKADHRWSGDRVGKTTLEYRDGVAVKEYADFRAYGSYEESFADYVEFLRNNPRYRDALERASDPRVFIKALQDAGYATDPAYATKIQRIMQSEPIAGLKISSEQTLS